MPARNLFIAALLIAMAALFVSFAQASPSCLSREQAARTWPAKELTRDDDGCWTYWRKGLRHEFADPTGMMPGTDRASKGADALTEAVLVASAPTVSQWSERWPDRIITIERPARPPDPPAPFITPRLIVTIISSIALTLAVIEALWGGTINPKIKRRHHDGYWT